MNDILARTGPVKQCSPVCKFVIHVNLVRLPVLYNTLEYHCIHMVLYKSINIYIYDKDYREYQPHYVWIQARINACMHVGLLYQIFI